MMTYLRMEVTRNDEQLALVILPFEGRRFDETLEIASRSLTTLMAERALWQPQPRIAASGGASTPAPLSTPFGGTSPVANRDDAEAAT